MFLPDGQRLTTALCLAHTDGGTCRGGILHLPQAARESYLNMVDNRWSAETAKG